MPDPLSQVTPLILTYNEEANIRRTIDGLTWADRIVVIDSGSTDDTHKILASIHSVELIQRRFVSFADQCNFGLSLINTQWCLSLDADHVVTPSFRRELAMVVVAAPEDLCAVLTPFCYHVYGKPLSGSLLPARFNLIRPHGGRYVNDGHAHRFIPQGRTVAMKHPILHDDRKPLERWLAAQNRYLAQETKKLLESPDIQLSQADRLRKLHIVAPIVVPLICLLWHRALLDGWRGWFYAFQRMYVETLLSLMLWEARQIDKSQDKS